MSLVHGSTTPTPGTDQGQCPACGRIIRTKDNGRLRRHGFALNRGDPGCPGSGANPEPITPAAVEHTHDRRSQ